MGRKAATPEPWTRAHGGLPRRRHSRTDAQRAPPSAAAKVVVVRLLLRVEAHVLQELRPRPGRALAATSSAGLARRSRGRRRTVPSKQLGQPDRPTGARLRSAGCAGRPWGRPRCEQTRTAAPASLRYCGCVGSDSRMRVSSATAPPSSGTLRSARTSTRLPSPDRCRAPCCLPIGFSWHASDSHARRTTSIPSRPRWVAMVAAGNRALAQHAGRRDDCNRSRGRVDALGRGAIVDGGAAEARPARRAAWAQVVGLGSPWRLALEAASGAPNQLFDHGLDRRDAGGMRTPTVTPPASAGLVQPTGGRR